MELPYPKVLFKSCSCQHYLQNWSSEGQKWIPVEHELLKLGLPSSPKYSCQCLYKYEAQHPEHHCPGSPTPHAACPRGFLGHFDTLTVWHSECTGLSVGADMEVACLRIPFPGSVSNQHSGGGTTRLTDRDCTPEHLHLHGRKHSVPLHDLLQSQSCGKRAFTSSHLTDEETETRRCLSTSQEQLADHSLPGR